MRSKLLQVELEEELEVLHNQYDPWVKSAETSGSRGIALASGL